MTTSKVYTVRKRTDSADLKDLFKVYLSPMALQLQSLAPGDLCMILKAGDVKGPVIVWPAPEKLLDTVILLSNRLKELYEIKLGEKISLSHNNYSLEDSSHVKLREVLQANPGTSSSTVSEADKPHWAWLSEYHLQEAKIICPGLVFDVEAKREKRTFVVIDVNSSSDRIFSRVQPKTKVSISDVSPTDGVIASHSFNTLHISGDGIGGLEKQLKQLNKRLSAYSNEEEGFECPPYHQPRRGGIILHGAPGTGKSTILRNFARAGWRKVLQIDTSIVGRRSVDIMNSVRQIFEESRGNQPSLVIIDKLELLAGKRSLHSDETLANIAPELGRELDQLGSARVLVVAATAFLENIDETLREPGRFEFDIEIPVPSSKARGEILKVLHWQAKDAENKMLEDLADRTHGFVGADLESLTQRAVDKAKARLSDSRSAEAAMVGNAGLDVKPKIKVEVTATDLNEALLEVRPRAMRQVFLQTPNVKWSDIGGQSEVKKALVQAVEWPFKVCRDSCHIVRLLYSHRLVRRRYGRTRN
jgi:AAA family ATPase